MLEELAKQIREQSDNAQQYLHEPRLQEEITNIASSALPACDARVKQRLERLHALLRDAEGEGADEVRDELAMLDLELAEHEGLVCCVLAGALVSLAITDREVLDRGRRIDQLELELGT